MTQKISKFFKRLEKKFILKKLRRESSAKSNEKKERTRKQLFTFISLVIAILITASIFKYFSINDKSSNYVGEVESSIYYNEACSGCLDYINDDLIPTLSKYSIRNLAKKDYINDEIYRREMNGLAIEYGIPFNLQGHIMTFVYTDITIILAGHVPSQIIIDLIQWNETEIPDPIMIIQDDMENPTDYYVWDFSGEIEKYSIEKPISEHLKKYSESDEFDSPTELDLRDDRKILPLIIINGILDGINPCAIAVLLFFIGFLFMLQRTKVNIIASGIIYIAAIFVIYFLIGLGLLNAIKISAEPHFMAKLGAGLVIFLGVINLIGFVWQDLPLKLEIPEVSRKKILENLKRATYPSTIVLGILVGLCTFPCSGGIYVATIGLLSFKASYVSGLFYLVIYNLMFVLPLIIILCSTSNRFVIKKVTEWHHSKRRLMKLIMGLIMISFGLGILYWWI